jgi:Type III secretion needle MxiH, YscF, SsaG, EprI, PscF, EscF
MGLDGILGGGNILGSLLNIASMVFPALQLASSLLNMFTQAVGGAIKGAIDQLMKESGLPKFIGEAVKKLVDEILGGNQQTNGAGGGQQAYGADGSQQSGADQQVQDTLGQDFFSNLMQGLIKQIVEDVKQGKEQSASGSSGSNGSGGSEGASTGRGGWLVALAKAFGKIADKAAKELEEAGKKLNNKNPSEMIEYQAKTQEFSQMMNTFTNAIKTIGEADAQAVRKS